MTREEYELIKLSDLNREDNIKYISSEAQGIALALDSDRYAPTFCKLERAYICGRRKSEKRIEKLEKENAELRDNYDQFKAIAEPEIERLQKENAVLERRIERAKECMKKLLFIINSDPANYNCKGLVQDAEDFIYNRTCNIRQHGEHCISETRCIMCDKEIEK